MSPTGSARGRSRVMPYGMDAFMLGIGMLGKPPVSSASLPPLPAVPGGSLEVYSGSGGAAKGSSAPRAGPPRAALPVQGRRDLFAIATCPLVAPGKTANGPPLPCDSRAGPAAAWPAGHSPRGPVLPLGSSSRALQGRGTWTAIPSCRIGCNCRAKCGVICTQASSSHTSTGFLMN